MAEKENQIISSYVRQPRISFGEEIKSNTILKDTEFTVWVNNLYNLNEYTTSINTKLELIQKISNYEYKIKAHLSGFQKIEVKITSKNKRFQLTSRSLLIMVI